MSNQTEDQILEVENHYWAGLAKDLVELEQDPRFQRLILNSYFKDLAVNQVSMLANEGIILDGKRPLINETLVSISRLQDYFITVKNLGTVSEEDYDEAEE